MVTGITAEMQDFGINLHWITVNNVLENSCVKEFPRNIQDLIKYWNSRLECHGKIFGKKE